MQINATFQPPYKNFASRAGISIVNLAFFSIIYWLIVFPYNGHFYTMLFIYVPLFAVLLYLAINRNVKYLKRVTVTNEKLIIEVVRFDKPYKTVELDITKVNIKIFDSLTSAAFGRKFRLIIDAKNDRGIYYTVYKQSETGDWTLNLFKSIYINYCDVTGKTPHTSSLASIGISEKKKR